MTTGVHEVMTVDDLNIRVCWEEVWWRNLDSKGLRELCSCEGTTGAYEVTTIDELHHPVLLGGGEGGGTLTSK